MAEKTLQQIQAEWEPKLQEIGDAIHEAVVREVGDLGWTIPKPRIHIDDRVVGPAVADQSLPWENDHSLIAFNPEFAEGLVRQGVDAETITDVQKTILTELYVRAAFKTDAGIRLARMVAKHGRDELPDAEAAEFERVNTEIIENGNASQYPWLGNKANPVTRIVDALKLPGPTPQLDYQLAAFADSFQHMRNQLATRLLQNEVTKPVGIAYRDIQTTLDNDKRLNIIHRMVRAVVRAINPEYLPDIRTKESISGKRSFLHRLAFGDVSRDRNVDVFEGRRQRSEPAATRAEEPAEPPTREVRQTRERETPEPPPAHGGSGAGRDLSFTL